MGHIRGTVVLGYVIDFAPLGLSAIYKHKVHTVRGGVVIFTVDYKSVVVHVYEHTSNGHELENPTKRNLRLLQNSPVCALEEEDVALKVPSGDPQ